MLAVVDQLASLTIRKSGRTPPKPGARLEDQHAGAALRQTDRRTQAGEAGADDHGVVTIHAGHSHTLSAISACCGRGTRARALKTS